MKPIDNISQYPTPEGLVLELVPAGFMVRAFAWSFDTLVRGLALIICSIALNVLGEMGTGLLLIITFLLTWLYPVYFEVWHDGMTLGKKRYGIYVCHDDGTPVSLSASMTRNLLRVVDFSPFLYSIGMVSLLFNKKSQRLGDMIAGTIVVYKNKDDISKITNSMKKLLDKQKDALQDDFDMNYKCSDPLFHISLTLTEQQAFVSIFDRLIFLPSERQQEITNYLSPLIHNPQQVHTAVLTKAKQLKGYTINETTTV